MILDLVRSLSEEEITILSILKEWDKNCRMGKRGMFNQLSLP
jgi:hypothetical protein